MTLVQIVVRLYPQGAPYVTQNSNFSGMAIVHSAPPKHISIKQRMTVLVIDKLINI